VYLSLGSNQGDRAGYLGFAREHLGRLPASSLGAVSGLFETEAMGYTDQPAFLNQVVALRTALPPLALLDATQALEAEAGRVRTVRWGPRTLDVDIIWYDGRSVREPRLQVPHPRMEERRFVLEPLAELAPDLVLPSGRTVRQASEALRGTEHQTVTPYRPGRG
jgi:2-amino-4-hydroxy-6-hydroxymethyldihydropteridine diphosphokinase